ncbi:MAG: amidohydrolase family protein [Deltaproteobacteria bacterium]|nr:amidohydrolase family protein [Deltaproteobacteria bacterium]
MGTTHDLVIRGGNLVFPDGVRRADLAVDDGVFTDIGAIPPESGPEIDARGCHVLPGAIDAHVHLGVEICGERSRDGYGSGTLAAVCGGVTTVGDFTVQATGEGLLASVKRRLESADEGSWCDWFLHANITSPSDAVLAEIPEVVEAGVTSFKLFLAYPGMAVGIDTLTDVLWAVKKAGGLVMVHAEDQRRIEVAVQELLDRGKRDAIHFFDSRPAEAEAKAVELVGLAAIDTGQPVYLVHVSSAKGLAAALGMRSRGARLHIETCPQYLLLDRPDSGIEHPEHLVCAPPLRSSSDRKALLASLSSGLIDVLATDHCPFTRAQKEMHRDDFRQIPGGLPGVETLLPLAYHLALGEWLPMERLAELLALNPSRLFGLDGTKGAIETGLDADFVVMDPRKETMVSVADLHSNTDYSPWEGMSLRGSLREVYLKGRLAATRNSRDVMEPVGLRRGRFIEASL